MLKSLPIVLLLSFGFAGSALAQENTMPVQRAAVKVNSSKAPANNKPYIVIVAGDRDYPVPADSVDKVESQTIRTISVLKDKKSTDKYGEAGENGVVLIHLKADAEKAFLKRIKSRAGKQIKLKGPLLTAESSPQ